MSSVKPQQYGLRTPVLGTRQNSMCIHLKDPDNSAQKHQQPDLAFSGSPSLSDPPVMAASLRSCPSAFAWAGLRGAEGAMGGPEDPDLAFLRSSACRRPAAVLDPDECGDGSEILFRLAAEARASPVSADSGGPDSEADRIAASGLPLTGACHSSILASPLNCTSAALSLKHTLIAAQPKMLAQPHQLGLMEQPSSYHVQSAGTHQPAVFCEGSDPLASAWGSLSQPPKGDE